MDYKYVRKLKIGKNLTTYKQVEKDLKNGKTLARMVLKWEKMEEGDFHYMVAKIVPFAYKVLNKKK